MTTFNIGDRVKLICPQDNIEYPLDVPVGTEGTVREFAECDVANTSLVGVDWDNGMPYFVYGYEMINLTNPNNLDETQRRLAEVFARCVDETENPFTVHNRKKNDQLQALLRVLEYINGDDNDNPMNDIFWEEGE